MMGVDSCDSPGNTEKRPFLMHLQPSRRRVQHVQLQGFILKCHMQPLRMRFTACSRAHSMQSCMRFEFKAQSLHTQTEDNVCLEQKTHCSVSKHLLAYTPLQWNTRSPTDQVLYHRRTFCCRCTAILCPPTWCLWQASLSPALHAHPIPDHSTPPSRAHH